MDLYSAARALSRPFVLDDADAGARLPIGARGLIGDGRSCALVRADGAIDWLCLPRFDSHSVFGALLDSERGGITQVTPVRRPVESLQRYDPGTNVLETLFRVPGEGVLVVTDSMPWTDDARAVTHEVHRRIQCREGSVEVELVFDPRFHYGAEQPTLELCEHGVLATARDRTTLAAAAGDVRWEPRPQGGMRARLRMRASERRWMVLSYGAPRPEPIEAYRPYETLRQTRHAWREWSRRLDYDGPWRHHVLRSALLLKLLIFARSGAMVAAPTTSLPEWFGGSRNWDYRYAWTRDAALAVRSQNLIGYRSEARDFFHFMAETLERAPDLRVMYTVGGGQVPHEMEVEHLRGFRDSRPVRIGNEARAQVQYDAAGALVDAAYLYERFGGALTLRAWRHLSRTVERVAADWRNPDHGIWEGRTAMQHNGHSKLMSWVALQRGADLAPLFGANAHQKAWTDEAQAVREDLLTNGLDPSGRWFPREYGGQRADAALLLLPIHGFLPAEDPRVEATIDRVRAELSAGPYLYRYRTGNGADGIDGIDEPEGAFVLCGFWLAEALALAGRLDEAQEVFTAHAEASNHVGLLAEEIDPSSGELLGNFPQAFSHLGLINAACRIDLALRLRDEGSTRDPRFLLP